VTTITEGSGAGGTPGTPGGSSTGSVHIATGEFRWGVPFPPCIMPHPRLPAQFYLVYRNQTEIDGITGNWDVTFNQRVVEDGNDVICYTGTGRSLDRFSGTGRESTPCRLAGARN